MALLTTARGTSVITEKIYETACSTWQSCSACKASIRLQGNTAVIEGCPS